jgi:DNA-binding phage protein
MATAAILRLPTLHRVTLDEGPATVAFVAQEIRLSGLTYQKLAARTGICVATISRIACGDTKLPRMSTVVRIALALGWQIEAVKDH